MKLNHETIILRHYERMKKRTRLLLLIFLLISVIGLILYSPSYEERSIRPFVNISYHENEKIFNFYKNNILTKPIRKPYVPWLSGKVSKPSWNFHTVWSEDQIFQTLRNRSDDAREKCETLGLASSSRRYKVQNSYGTAFDQRTCR